MPLEKIFGKLLGNSLHHHCNQCLHHFNPRIITSFTTTTPCTTPVPALSELFIFENNYILAEIASNCDWQTDKFKKEN